MMKTIVTLCVALAIGLTTTSASAAKRPMVKAVVQRVMPVFQAADVDNSGSLNSAEWATTGAPANSFDGVDLNSNGNIGIYEMVRVAVTRIMASRKR